jgi:drug/metabolite transporter (DMT)-like permease
VNWASTATLSATILGWVNILDSHLISRRMPGLRAFLLPVGISHLSYGLLFFYLFPLPDITSITPVLVAIASAIARTAAITIMLYSLKRRDVARVIPVVYTYPIFVAIMAVPLLGETLHYLDWLAVIIVVTGAVTLSAEKNTSGSINRLSKPSILLFASSIFFAIADICGKYALTYISFWNMFSLTAFCMSGTFFLL